MFDPQIPYNDLPQVTTLFIDTSSGLAKLAEDTRVAIEILKYAVKILPDPNILLDTLALQEARSSSTVENIITTNDDLYRGAMFEDFTAEAREVSMYKAALLKGYNFVLEKGSISMSDIEEINRPVNKQAAGIRTNLPNFGVQTRLTASESNEVIYTPPHGKELLQELLIDMLDFIYDDDVYDLHPLIKIALAHYQFESIHPFRDGNGRTGRILNILFLCQKGYLDTPILYASSYIMKNKLKYYELLRTTKETEIYEPIVEYMLTSFKETAERTLLIVEGIRKLLDQYTNRDFLEKLTGQYEPLKKTVEIVFKKAYIRNADLIKGELGLHRQTAAAYLDQLVECGLLTKEKVGRDNIYKNIKLMELFENDGEEVQ